jgi:hypothetical protein
MKKVFTNLRALNFSPPVMYQQSLAMKQNLISSGMPQLFLYVLRTMLVITLVTSFQSCKDPDIVTETPVSKLDEKETQVQALSSYLAGITGASVDKVKYVEEDKMFIIDNDMVVSRNGAEQYLNAQKSGRTNQRQNVWLLNDNVVQDIKIYINPAITPGWKTAIRQAIVDWNALGETKVNFREILFDYGADVVISTKFEAPNPDGRPNWIARQYFPDADGTTGGGMTINTYYNDDNALSMSKKRNAITHELGHSIGLSHTDEHIAGYFDYQVCNTPAMDDNSVMNSVVHSWAGFTYFDMFTVQLLYPSHTWTYYPGLASDVGAGYGPSKSLWMIGKTAVNGGYSIQQFNYATKTFTAVPGGAVRISVGGNGVPWVVNNLGQIFKRVNNSWQQLPGSALDIAVSANGSVFMVSTTPATGGFAVKFWKDNQWKQMPGRGALRIAVSPEGEPWAIDNANKVLKRSGQSLVDAGSTGRDIAAGPNGSVFVIGLSEVPGGYSIKKYIFGCWSQMSGGGVAITTHGNGAGPVVINNLGMVVEY